MYKQHLLNNIKKEINICSRLYTKISPDQMDYRPKEGVRSIMELLQYISVIGGAMPKYWLKKDDTDFNTFFTSTVTSSRDMTHGEFLNAMDKQLAAITEMFDQLSDEDLFKDVTYPWGGTAALGEGIMATSVKWLAAYKLQLFLFIKLSGDQKLSTADAWVLTDEPS